MATEHKALTCARAKVEVRSELHLDKFATQAEVHRQNGSRTAARRLRAPPRWILQPSSHGRSTKGTSPCMHAWTKWPRWHEGSCSPPRGIRPKHCTGYLMVGSACILHAESPCLIGRPVTSSLKQSVHKIKAQPRSKAQQRLWGTKRWPPACGLRPDSTDSPAAATANT